MLRRCRDVKHKNYDRYGGRGIQVCDRWQTFEHFLSDMGQPQPRQTIERRDNDGNYCLENCYWASRKVQGRNTATTIRVELNGVRMSLPEACELSGLKHHPVYMRMRRGMTFADAISKNIGRIRA